MWSQLKLKQNFPLVFWKGFRQFLVFWHLCLIGELSEPHPGLERCIEHLWTELASWTLRIYFTRLILPAPRILFISQKWAKRDRGFCLYLFNCLKSTKLASFIHVAADIVQCDVEHFTSSTWTLDETQEEHMQQFTHNDKHLILPHPYTFVESYLSKDIERTSFELNLFERLRPGKQNGTRNILKATSNAVKDLDSYRMFRLFYSVCGLTSEENDRRASVKLEYGPRGGSFNMIALNRPNPSLTSKRIVAKRVELLEGICLNISPTQRYVKSLKIMLLFEAWIAGQMFTKRNPVEIYTDASTQQYQRFEIHFYTYRWLRENTLKPLLEVYRDMPKPFIELLHKDSRTPQDIATDKILGLNPGFFFNP